MLLVCEGGLVVVCAYCYTRLILLWRCITQYKTIIFCQAFGNNQILHHEGV